MGAKYIIHRRGRSKLVGLEILGISVFAAYYACKQFNWEWIAGLAITLVISVAIGFLFFRFRIFRYVFAILFSLAWGALAFGFASLISRSDFSMCVAFILIALISLFAHKKYFRFKRDAERIDIEEH